MTLFAADTSMIDPRTILTSIGEAVYDWDILSDSLSWGANAQDVLKVRENKGLGSGKGFAQFLDPESLTSRYETILHGTQRDLGMGVPYQIQYSFLPRGRDNELRLWIEDTGRWFAGEGGRPVRAHGVVRVINERHETEQRLTFMSRYDELTGQLNRMRLTESLADVIENAIRFRNSVGCLIAGIDNLSRINEACGFEAADQVIVAIAQRIRGQMRGGDILGRFSGNKFGIVLINCDTEEMPIAAQRFIAAVAAEPIQTKAGPVSARISIGGALAPRHGDNPTDLLNRAQEALNACKSTRRGGYLGYAPSRDREAQRVDNARITEEVVSALNDKRMLLAFQPIVHASTGKPALHECLVRLRKLDGTILSASSIVPVTEKLGLVRLVDHRVMELAVDAMEAHPEARCTINLSAATADDQDWLAAFALRLHRREDVAKRLIVEITESSVIADLDAMNRFVATMKEYGVKVAIDDFGAGYTSFKALRDLNVDMVKIDGAFVQNMLRSSDDRFFVKTLIDLARHLDLDVVAEWVQNRETAELLAEWGCNYLQGSLYGAADVEVPWMKPVHRIAV